MKKWDVKEGSKRETWSGREKNKERVIFLSNENL